MARLVKFLKGGPHVSVLHTLNAVLFDGSLSTSTTDTVSVSTADGQRIVFKGDFTISGGIVTGGMVTSFDVWFGSIKVMKANGYAVPIADALDAIDAANVSGTETFNNLFFRAAKMKGSSAEDTLFALEGGKALAGDGNDFIMGFGSGPVILKGGDGDDTFLGNGKSKLWGGAGDDIFHFRFPGGADKAKDFSIKDDIVGLHPDLFASINYSVGPIDDLQFRVGEAATTPGEIVLYDKKTGSLSIDLDGSGAMAKVQVGILPDHLKLKADDIFIADLA